MADLKLTQIPESIPIGKAKSKRSLVVEVDDPHGQLEVSSGGLRWTPRGESGRLISVSAVQHNWKQLIELITPN